MNSASRRTGTYLYSSASASAPRRVRAPQTTRPTSGKVRRQLIPRGFSCPFSASVSVNASGRSRRPARRRCPPAPSTPRGWRRCGPSRRRSPRRRRSRRSPRRAADPGAGSAGSTAAALRIAVPIRPSSAGQRGAPRSMAVASTGGSTIRKRPVLEAEAGGVHPQARRQVARRLRRRQAQQVEQVGLEQGVQAPLRGREARAVVVVVRLA